MVGNRLFPEEIFNEYAPHTLFPDPSFSNWKKPEKTDFVWLFLISKKKPKGVQKKPEFLNLASKKPNWHPCFCQRHLRLDARFIKKISTSQVVKKKQNFSLQWTVLRPVAQLYGQVRTDWNQCFIIDCSLSHPAGHKPFTWSHSVLRNTWLNIHAFRWMRFSARLSVHVFTISRNLTWSFFRQ